MQLPTSEELKHQNFKWPAIGFSIMKTEPYNIGVIRSLTDTEWSEIESYKETYVTADIRISALRIVILNYEAIMEYLNNIKADKNYKLQNRMIHMDRLLMNYLTSVYGVHEHYLNFFRRVNRNEASRLCSETSKLEKTNFPLAFFRDFRNYVQHEGMPTGCFKTIHKVDEVGQISVTCQVDLLLKNYDRWVRSKLADKRGATLDLLGLLEQHYAIVIKFYQDFILKHFLPLLAPFHNCVARLTKEVKDHNPDAILEVFSRYDDYEINQQRKYEYGVTGIPKDVFASLGINIAPVSDENMA